MSDKFHGVGGSYIEDADGNVTLVERTFDPNQEAAGKPQPESPEPAPADNTDQEEA